MNLCREEYLSLISDKKYQEKIRNFISSRVYGHHNIEDLLQKTNLTLIQKYNDYEHSNKITSWGLRIAFWKVKEWKKKEARAKVSFDQDLFEVNSQTFISNKSEEDFDHFDFEILNKKIDFILNHSSENTKLIFKLHLLGFKPREIQKKTGLKISLIYKTSQRIKDKLKKELRSYKR